MLDPDKQSLYHRLGGHDTIAALVEDLVARLTADPTLGVYWNGKCNDSMRKDKQLLLEFLCMAFGGPSYYLGRDMKTSHEGLGITTSMATGKLVADLILGRTSAISAAPYFPGRKQEAHA